MDYHGHFPLLTMRDITESIVSLDQRAKGTITYGAPVAGVKATGTVTLVDYLKAIQQTASGSITYGNPVEAVKATGTVTVVDYLKAILTAATASITYGNPVEAEYASGTITYGVPVDGDHVTVNGTIFTKVAANPDPADEFTSISQLTALVNGLANINATDNGTVITVKADVRGTAGNAYTLARDGTGTLSVSGATLTGGVNGDTVIVNGTTLTCVASGAGANEFTDITSLEVLTEALSDINSSENGTVVTLTSATAGSSGNSKTLALGGANAGTMTISGANFTGGYNNLVITFNGTALTQGTDFTAETSNNATATNIAAAIDAIAGVGASANAAVVTITNDAYGTAGNAKTLVTSDTAAATVSGATLSGGVNGDTVIVDGNTFTCVTSSPGANEFSTITELEVLVEAVSGLNSTENGTVVSITASSAGAAGNSKTLALGGANAGTMTVSGATLTGGQDHLTITVNGNALVQGTNFTAETSNAVTATNLATAIAALANVTASANSNVVTITADAEGTTANSYNTLTSNTNAATVGGATMSGGVNGDTVTVASTTMTCVTSSPGAQEFTNIAELTVLVDAIANIDATDDGSVVSIAYTTPGAAGNSTALSVGGANAGTMAVSGATLTGGGNSSFSAVKQVESSSGKVAVFVTLDTFTGNSPTLDVTPYVSADGINFAPALDDSGNAITLAQFTAAGTKYKIIPTCPPFIKLDLNLGGTNPVANGSILYVVV